MEAAKDGEGRMGSCAAEGPVKTTRGTPVGGVLKIEDAGERGLDRRMQLAQKHERFQQGTEIAHGGSRVT